MVKLLIKINDIDKVKEFLKITSKMAEEVDLVSGHCVIDGKSIIGVYALDLTRPIELRIHSENQELTKLFSAFAV